MLKCKKKLGINARNLDYIIPKEKWNDSYLGGLLYECNFYFYEYVDK